MQRPFILANKGSKISWGWELKQEKSRLAAKCRFLMEKINNHRDNQAIDSPQQIPHRVKSQN